MKKNLKTNDLTGGNPKGGNPLTGCKNNKQAKGEGPGSATKDLYKLISMQAEIIAKQQELLRVQNLDIEKSTELLKIAGYSEILMDMQRSHILKIVH
ncbi:MAG: hypothetical protein NTX43_13870 [Bacteroidetes bacterium]|nr:hypothetical protein [Bacteroidota bacterium]